MSDDKVTRLFPDRAIPTEFDADTAGQAPLVPNEQLIECLEAFLDSARAGLLQRLYAVGLGGPAHPAIWRAMYGLGDNVGNYYESLGAITDMQSDFQTRHFAMLEGFDPEDIEG